MTSVVAAVIAEWFMILLMIQSWPAAVLDHGATQPDTRGCILPPEDWPAKRDEEIKEVSSHGRIRTLPE